MTETGRIAVVTGAASGIGLASVERLARDGFGVVLLDRSEEVTARAAALRDAGLQADSLVGDLVDSATIAATKQFVQDRFGRCDVLLNNAGVASRVRQGTVLPKCRTGEVGVRHSREHDGAIPAFPGAFPTDASE